MRKGGQHGEEEGCGADGSSGGRESDINGKRICILVCSAHARWFWGFLIAELGGSIGCLGWRVEGTRHRVLFHGKGRRTWLTKACQCSYIDMNTCY